MTDTDNLKRLAEAAGVFNYEGWEYVPPKDGLSSGRVAASNQGPVLAVIQWPVPTVDYVLARVDASHTVGEFIAASSPKAILALIAENERLKGVNAKRAATIADLVMERDEAVALLREWRLAPLSMTGLTSVYGKTDTLLASIDAKGSE